MNSCADYTASWLLDVVIRSIIDAMITKLTVMMNMMMMMMIISCAVLYSRFRKRHHDDHQPHVLGLLVLGFLLPSIIRSLDITIVVQVQ